jgi:hypothetical protein
MELVRLGIQQSQMKTSLMTAVNTMEDTMAILDSNESHNEILARLGEIGKFAEPSRRNFMALGASAGIGLGLGSIGTSALAKAPKLRVQSPYWYRFNVGEAEITVVSDGWQMLGDPSNSFLGVPKDEVRKELTDNFMNPSDMNIELNSFVVNSNDKMVLFDTGLGASKMFGPKGGLLAKSLSDAGIKREDINAVVISHGHIDHIGGIVDESGALMYPNAQVYMSQADFDYWTDERQMDSPWKKAFIIHARKNLLPVRDRLIFFKDERSFSQASRQSRRQATRSGTPCSTCSRIVNRSSS